MRKDVGIAALMVMLALAGCGEESPSPSASAGTGPDLSAIACATADPTDVGELTGAWSGNDSGVYYIRQVGDCVWWFGTEIEPIERGVTGQPGFANVASGRFDGGLLELEWADIPLGRVLGGGGLTFVYDAANDRLLLTEQRGDWIPFGGTELTRIEPEASPEASPSASSSP
jgi:hypothetical protein